MPDPGLIGVGIRMTVDGIIRYIKTVRRYRKELGVLEDSLMKIEPMIQRIRLAWNYHKDEVSAVENWFEELEALLKQASEIVRSSDSIPRWDVVSCRKMSTKITDLSTDIDKQLKLFNLVHMFQDHVVSRKILEGQKEINGRVKELKERMEVLMASPSGSAITYQGAHVPTGTIYSEKGDKTETGTANRLSNPSKVSSFQDQQLDALVLKSYENPMSGCLKQRFVSHDTEEGVPTEKRWFGEALLSFPAGCDGELNLTAGEKVEILGAEEEWFYVSNGIMVGRVPMLFVNPY